MNLQCCFSSCVLAPVLSPWFLCEGTLPAFFDHSRKSVWGRWFPRWRPSVPSLPGCARSSHIERCSYCPSYWTCLARVTCLGNRMQHSDILELLWLDSKKPLSSTWTFLGGSFWACSLLEWATLMEKLKPSGEGACRCSSCQPQMRCQPTSTINLQPHEWDILDVQPSGDSRPSRRPPARPAQQSLAHPQSHEIKW